MPKTKKEEPIVDNEVGSIKVKEKKEVESTSSETKDNVTKVKEKMTMKHQAQEPTITKIDLSKPLTDDTEPTDSNQDQKVQKEVVEKEIVEEITSKQSTEENVETPIIEEVTEEVEETAAIVEEAISDSIETGKELPEGVQKLMDFMEETGGDLNDYVKLNQDYSKLDNDSLLKEYYKQTKPHLNSEEIEFLMEDQFSFDQDVDEDKDIRRKKLALKEQVADAKSHLDGLKSKYYKDIKYGSKLTSEQQKAIDFFNRYNKESEENQKNTEAQQTTFTNKTNQVFNDKFKGFEYNIGEKRFRFNVKDVDSVKQNQSDVNNFIKKFLNKKNQLEDARGYHKSLFTAMNSDAVANHFYEQGKADALKTSVAKSKNISMDPRQQHSGEIGTGGLKFKVLGENSNDFKFKIKNK